MRVPTSALTIGNAWPVNSPEVSRDLAVFRAFHVCAHCGLTGPGRTHLISVL